MSQSLYPDLRTTDDPPISVVQGTPIEDGPPACCPTAAVSSTVPFGLPVYSEVQARRYEPLDQTRSGRADDEGTGPSWMQCFIVMLRSPVALLVALNYCVGFDSKAANFMGIFGASKKTCSLESMMKHIV